MAKKFEEFNLNRQLLNAVADAGFTEATPIQEKAIAPVLLGVFIFVALRGSVNVAYFNLIYSGFLIFLILMLIHYIRIFNFRKS